MTALDVYSHESLPFENYPSKGRVLLGKVRGDNCRHGNGLKFMRLTRQICCAYCGLNFEEAYENWLNIALDHVVPSSTCQSWNIPVNWCEDYSNRILSCTTCNTFWNRYKPNNLSSPSTLDEFYNLRDIIFSERKQLIFEKHKQERAFFDTKPWAI